MLDSYWWRDVKEPTWIREGDLLHTKAFNGVFERNSGKIGFCCNVSLLNIKNNFKLKKKML